jgi:hypothetical protein
MLPPSAPPQSDPWEAQQKPFSQWPLQQSPFAAHAVPS